MGKLKMLPVLRPLLRVLSSSKGLAAIGGIVALFLVQYRPEMTAEEAESLATNIVYVVGILAGAIGLEDGLKGIGGKKPQPEKGDDDEEAPAQ